MTPGTRYMLEHPVPQVRSVAVAIEHALVEVQLHGADSDAAKDALLDLCFEWAAVMGRGRAPLKLKRPAKGKRAIDRKVDPGKWLQLMSEQSRWRQY